jgi:hypothetical protein
MPEVEQLPIIPALMIHVLPEQLYWWLCAICFHLRHVQVIHENHASLANRGPKFTLPPLVQLAIDDVLQTSSEVSVLQQDADMQCSWNHHGTLHLSNSSLQLELLKHRPHLGHVHTGLSRKAKHHVRPRLFIHLAH